MIKSLIIFSFIFLIQSIEISFGSCAGMFGIEKEKIWKSILKRNPSAFIWLGDAIYADDMVVPLLFLPVDEERWRTKYEIAKNAPGYKELRQKVKIFGVWDDHDYGVNNENKYFTHKELSKKLFLEFLDEPLDSIRYQREGIYESYKFIENNIKIKIILLDNRTFLDPNGKDSDILGEAQWIWLEQELKETNISLFIIMNGMKIFVEDEITVSEKWYPKSRDRLASLLQQHPNSILITGDVHYSEILEISCNKYSVIEFTSSGLTHSIYGTCGFICPWFMDFWYPYTNNVTPRVYTESFGSIEVKENGKIELRGYDEDGNTVLSYNKFIHELWEIKENSWDCEKDLLQKRCEHIIAFLLVFIVPWITWLISGFLFIKKYSNSY